MELRARTALLAGRRTASRWVSSTLTTASKPSIFMPIHAAAIISRPFSSTFPARQEAEAPIPSGPTPSMAEYMTQRRQQVQQQQQQQRTPPSQSPSTLQTGKAIPPTNDVFAPEPANATPASMKAPWTAPKIRTMAPGGALFAHDMDPVAGLGLYNPNEIDLQEQDGLGRFENPLERRLRLRPVIGRTIDLTTARDPANRDLARGLQQLETDCRANGVRRDVNRQRAHERPGLRRKRLKSERYGRRFKAGFVATADRVKKLAKQGW